MVTARLCYVTNLCCCAGRVQQGCCVPYLWPEACRLCGALWLPAAGAACVPRGLLPQHGAAAAVHLQNMQQGAAAGGGAAALDQVSPGKGGFSCSWAAFCSDECRELFAAVEKEQQHWIKCGETLEGGLS